jgi:hypothetical protein
MAFVALLIGAILIVSAINNTHGQLASELEKDVPGYFVWAAALCAVAALGFIPGLRTPSRWLLGLIVFVIVLKNWNKLLGAVQSFTKSGGQSGGQVAADPSAAYVANPSAGVLPTAYEIAGTAPSGSASTSMNAGGGSSFNPAQLAQVAFDVAAVA